MNVKRQCILANFLCWGCSANNRCDVWYWCLDSALLKNLIKSKKGRKCSTDELKVLFFLPIFSTDSGDLQSKFLKILHTPVKWTSAACSSNAAALALSLPTSISHIFPSRSSQSALIILIHLLPWLYITIYHLSSLCCPPSHYLLSLFYSPWHASIFLSCFWCCLVFLCIGLGFFHWAG